jgi:subtilisin family serine protease
VHSQLKKLIAGVSTVSLAISLTTFFTSSVSADSAGVTIEASGFSKANRYIVSGNLATKNFVSSKFAGKSREIYGNFSVVFAKKGKIVSALRESGLNLGTVQIYPDKFVKTPRVDSLRGGSAKPLTAEELASIRPAHEDPVITGDDGLEFQWSLWPNYDWMGSGTNMHGVDLLTALHELDDMEIDSGEGVNVAIIDTGYTVHPELVVADSADFTTGEGSNDGTEDWDNDGADPGDWCDDDDETTEDLSSWHGTHVHGTIAASRDSGVVLGIAYDANVVHARALGQCGGYSSDIAAAILWSAGFSFEDDGIIDNAYPADIINMSLGGTGLCDPLYNTVINAVRYMTDTLVVVSAGNGYDPAASSSPASCKGAFTVASTGPSGERAYYSNYGVHVDIAAPGGDWCDTKFSQWGFGDFADCIQSLEYWESYEYVDTNQILSTLNAGAQTPGEPSYAWYQGTSMAAPHVSGVAALVLSVNPGLSADQLEEVLQGSASAFGDIEYEGYYLDRVREKDDMSCNLHEYMCGSGIVNAHDALLLALETEPSDGSRVTRVNITPGGTLTKGTANVEFFAPWYEDPSYVEVVLKATDSAKTTRCRVTLDSISGLTDAVSCNFSNLRHDKVYQVTITPMYGRTAGEVVTRIFKTAPLPTEATFKTIRVVEWEDIYYGMYNGLALVSWNKPRVPTLAGTQVDDAYFIVEAYSYLADEMWNLCTSYGSSCAIPFMIPGDRVKFRIITMTTRGTIVSKWSKWYTVPGTIPVG